MSDRMQAVKGDGLFLQPCQPGFADEFPVGQEAGDLVDPEEPEDAMIAIRSLVLELPALSSTRQHTGMAMARLLRMPIITPLITSRRPSASWSVCQPPRLARLEPHQRLGYSAPIPQSVEVARITQLQSPIVVAGSRAPRKVGSPQWRGSPSGRRTRRRFKTQRLSRRILRKAKLIVSVSSRALIGLSRMISLLTHRGNRESYNLFNVLLRS